MTAIRLRGQDAIDRALEARELNLETGMSVQEIADHYQATERAVYDWLKLAKKHTLPPLDDRMGWFNLIIQDQGARLEDAKDADSVRIAQLLSQMMGVGTLEELRAQAVNIEHAKVRLMAERLGEAFETAGIPVTQRRKVLEALTS